MAEEKKPSETEILFPEMEVEGVMVKPWGFGQLAAVSPCLRRAVKEFEKAGITFENIQDHMPDLVFVLLAEGPEIVSRTTGIDLETVRSWDPAKSIPILMTIMAQNLEKIKNFFGPSLTLMNRLKKLA